MSKDLLVIDGGCARHGDDYSIERLVEEFQPSRLAGFDPSADPADYLNGDTHVIVHRQALWTADTRIGFKHDGLRGHVDEALEPTVTTTDLARFILHQSRYGPIILKLDVEGAEHPLLEHLIEQGADKLLQLAWVEWHDLPDGSHTERRASIEERIGCELREWTW